MVMPTFGPDPNPLTGGGGTDPIDTFFQEGVPEFPSETRTVQELANAGAAEDLIETFMRWAIIAGIASPDPNNIEQSEQFYEAIRASAAEEEAAGAGGAASRIQFPSEAALDFATAGLRQEQSLTEAFSREALRQQAASAAFDRARDKFTLLQTTDQLADARREAAVNALIAAAPFFAPPGAEFTPGLEPGGAGQVLGNLLGANVPAQRLPTAELPLSELANPPLAAPAADITAGLNPLLAAGGTPQI